MHYDILFYVPWAAFSGLACYLYLYRQRLEAGQPDQKIGFKSCSLAVAIDVTLGAFSGCVCVILLRSLGDVSDDAQLVASIVGGYGNRSFPSIVEMWIDRFKGKWQ